MLYIYVAYVHIHIHMQKNLSRSLSHSFCVYIYICFDIMHIGAGAPGAAAELSTLSEPDHVIRLQIRRISYD